MDAKARKSLVRRNFLEQLRELGEGVGQTLKKEVVKEIPKTALRQVLKIESSQGEIYQAPEKKTEFVWSKQEMTSFYLQEKALRQESQQEIALQIQALRAELIKLVKSVRNMSREVEIAAFQAPVEPGLYHLNFFEELRETIIMLTKSIKESFNWLSACNRRAKKRSHYWTQVQKSGSKYMLSQERYMATQTG